MNNPHTRQSVNARKTRFNCSSFSVGLFLLGLLTVTPPAFSQNYRSPIILSPYKLDFARVLVGKESNPQTVTVFNNGASPQPLSSITITGDFSETNDCPKPPATLAVQAACEIKVSYKPLAIAPSSSTLTITAATANTQLVVLLYGSGTPGKPTATISPSSLAFPAQTLGVQSSPQSIVVTNTGTEMLSIGNVQTSGDFLALPESTCNNEAGPLAPGATCTIQISFAPLEQGQRTGELSIDDNAEGSPQKVALTGTGK